MFDDPADDMGLWTEEIIGGHLNAIVAVRPHLKRAVAANIGPRLAYHVVVMVDEVTTGFVFCVAGSVI